ncbi:Flp pilus assembly protein CpaB [Haloactinopolyspora alba]|uniref:Flp pilus assembly protein CpaB n=1 Tax=Haloactinopolyspora alba TaxID=648780 RepID=A0A2P8E557_9ACTN|nr:SAF domain-containing protein [Haloactinopolyspora alba]PSL04595.1 Flp pilus assembly protein CpaB [Haloactinopolyspora alba]
MNDVRALAHRLAGTASWHRRLLAGGLAAAAVALAVEAASPPAPDQEKVTVAERDLAGGTTITADDLTTASMPPDAVPGGVLGDDAVGRVLAGPVRAGEAITDRRVLGPGLLRGWGSGLVATPIRLADPGAAAYLRHGDRIDVLGTALNGAGRTDVVASGVPVLARATGDDDTAATGALLMVAATPGQAADLAAAAVSSRLSFTLGAAP